MPLPDPGTDPLPLEPSGPSLRFDNSFVRELPGDPDTVNVPRPVLGACYSWVRPSPVAAAKTLAVSHELARTVGLGDWVQTEGFARVFSGSAVLPGMETWSACYGGHQFGNWAGQLGDGRAISLGELVTPPGRRWELQLKGAGPTPYSRTADGRAVLRSSVREFLCSEAMHHLGVPTTRALSLVATGERVLRDMFYDGRPEHEPGAVVCRVAPSFLRFGNYELLAAREDVPTLRRLVDYTIDQHFPELGPPSPSVYAAWLGEIGRRTAEMITGWMRVGFVHGVMNTDNMSILGLTIDYGPYGWLDDYDPSWTPNTTDAHGRRYRFSNQPQIALWNLVQLARALEPLVGDIDQLRDALGIYQTTLDAAVKAMMAAKLGFRTFEPEHDVALVDRILRVLQETETDMTIFYRRLAEFPCAASSAPAPDDAALVEHFRAAHYGEPGTAAVEAIAAGLREYQSRVRRDRRSDRERAEFMNRANPAYVLRNYLAQVAIDRAEAGAPGEIHELMRVLERPYTADPRYERFAQRRPEWARDRPGCSTLSCSS